MAAAGTDTNFAFSNRSELVLSLALLGVLIVLLVPLPPVLLDMLLAVNLAFSILLLLITLGVQQPLELSVFPSLLLLLTLYRLSLNAATTRLILLDGDAGKIVSTFGGFVVGGNLIVGMVMFLILIVIQFIVITRGAGRVSEVAARFTLDALPGKQMAIDAELGAGAIDETQARERREGLAREAEFYGAMDGASKFVRGDAIAGLLVTAVNLLGGIVLGVMNNLSLAEAASRYSTLTIGDGLVSQIPALLVAVSSGILVTKGGSKSSLGQEISGQVTQNLRPLSAGAMMLSLMALAPGLPKLPFLALAGGLALAVRRVTEENTKQTEAAAESEETDAPAPPDPLDGFLQTERVCVEIGARLIPLVESGQNVKGLADRISSLRSELTKKHGLWVPAVRIRDNIQLGPEEYRLLISGREVARGELRPERQLAISTGHTSLSLRGEETTDPAFGLKAYWIDAGERARANLAGYTVVDVGSVLITHLSEVLRNHAHELLSRDDLALLLEQLRATAPAIVDELKADNSVRTSVVHQVLLLLLEEQVSIVDLATILESLMNNATRTKDPEELVEFARQGLGRTICDPFRDAQGRVRVAVLEPRLEHQMQEAIRDGNLLLSPGQLERLLGRCSEFWQKAQQDGEQVALLTDAVLRRAMRKTLLRALPYLTVISYAEVPRDMRIEPLVMIRHEEVWQDFVANEEGRVPPTAGGDAT